MDFHYFRLKDILQLQIVLIPQDINTEFPLSASTFIELFPMPATPVPSRKIKHKCTSGAILPGHNPRLGIQ
jgi:hypothetical protein